MGEEKGALTWAQLLDECSRLHTTRTRRMPWGTKREDSRMIRIAIDGRRATVVPTRMHEPGFYFRWDDLDGADAEQRADSDLALLERWVTEGRVTRV